MGALRSRIRLVVATAVLALCAAALLAPTTPISVTAGSTTASVWLQTMDSCESALGGAQYQIVGDNDVDTTVTTRSATKTRIASGTCPYEQGNCSSTTLGCVELTDLPPGSYRIHEITTPPADSSNPEGYAACNGGSACRRQEVDLTVSSSGTASATVTNVYPNGYVATYPIASAHAGRSTYAGTTKDPIVVHNFGLAPPGFSGAAQCDGDSDADDHSTGSPSSRCQYPENEEATACRPFPWSCTLVLWPPVTSTTTTTTTSSTSTGSSTTTNTTTSTTDTTTTDSTTTDSTTTTAATTTGCALTGTKSGSLNDGSTSSLSFMTVAAGAVSAEVGWTPSGTVRLQLIDSSGTVVGQVTVTGTSLQLASASLAPGTYKLSVKNEGSRTVTYTLSYTHC